MHAGVHKDHGRTADRLQPAGQEARKNRAKEIRGKKEPENSCSWDVHDADPEKVSGGLLRSLPRGIDSGI